MLPLGSSIKMFSSHSHLFHPLLLEPCSEIFYESCIYLFQCCRDHNLSQQGDFSGIAARGVGQSHVHQYLDSATPSIHPLLLFLYLDSNDDLLKKMEPDLRMKNLERYSIISVHGLS